MRFDLKNNSEPLDALPRFQLAKNRVNKLSFASSTCMQLAIGLFLLAIVIKGFTVNSLWPTLFCNNAAVLLLLAAVARSALRIDVWRSNAFDGACVSNTEADEKELITTPVNNDEKTAKSDNKEVAKPSYLVVYGKRLIKQIGVAPLLFIAISAITLVVVYIGWNMSLSGINTSKTSYAIAGLLVLSAFSLLVIERHLSNTSKNQWPEAVGIALIIRVVIAVQALSLFALLFVDVGRVWPLRLLVLTGLLPILVAIEFIVRAFLSIFSPQRDTLEPQLIGDSLVAAMLRWPPQPLTLLQDELQHHFNIDLRQVWAFGFMRRAFLPILSLILVLGWLLTSISEVPINGRGIYERFGRPVAVLKSGLHVGLPWPFGKVISVENGVIHEMATSSDQNAQGQVATLEEKNVVVEVPTVEGTAPESANRLWDASHRSEKSQIIASASNDKQSFQILNMDVRFIYRIGPTDQDALDATYNNLDIPVLIKSIANRVLVHEFSSRTLDEVLSGRIQQLTKDVQQGIQQDLDQMKSGVELLAVVVEAVHPPAGAANAYHGVQAAQIMSQVLIAQERGNAADTMGEAHITAANLVDKSQAEAKEAIALAQSDVLRFDAEKTAWQKANQAFLLEQYFNQLSISFAKAPLLIIDHRLTTSDMPTIDLRKFSVPLDTTIKSTTQATGD
ncbi:protease modulator HflK [Entomomonas moraniae]|uniref:Protease modulator HflK n=1 Tax=Entomomonas moraniae TaxID=2213226 RepID=A0A3Q9JMS4_9GAMM|nr:protease modulator HflK [Entomomonas moraniae]AZS51087.1 protease modulator HflK [Entomomonas moraniae]